MASADLIGITSELFNMYYILIKMQLWKLCSRTYNCIGCQKLLTWLLYLATNYAIVSYLRCFYELAYFFMVYLLMQGNVKII